MKRRTLLVAGGATAVVGLTGAPARAAAGRPIFEWARPRGVLRPPVLVIYDDDTAYADAATSLPLRPRQAASLRAHAAEVLGDARNLVRDAEGPVREGPVDRVSVRGEDGRYLTAELDRAFSEPLLALDRHVQDLSRTVRRGGEPWRPNAVRLATVRLDDVPGASEPWPDGVPHPSRSVRYAERDVRGRPAQLVRHLMPSGLDGWPAYRVPPSAFVRASWRHLLPHEL